MSLKAVANVERAIMKALERQYADILTPLKDSIPKRLGIQVQKLTRKLRLRKEIQKILLPIDYSLSTDCLAFFYNALNVKLLVTGCM